MTWQGWGKQAQRGELTCQTLLQRSGTASWVQDLLFLLPQHPLSSTPLSAPKFMALAFCVQRESSQLSPPQPPPPVSERTCILGEKPKSQEKAAFHPKGWQALGSEAGRLPEGAERRWPLPRFRHVPWAGPSCPSSTPQVKPFLEDRKHAAPTAVPRGGSGGSALIR